MSSIQIEAWPSGHDLDRDVIRLGEILHSVVHEDPGLTYLVPFSLEEACSFWKDKVLAGALNGTRRVLVARSEGQIVGTVQLDLNAPPNQRHRAEVNKLLVHQEARRGGVARALMAQLEEVARSEKRTLLMLDTWTGSGAEELYRSLGFQTLGIVPRFARESVSHELAEATFMYKELAP